MFVSMVSSYKFFNNRNVNYKKTPSKNDNIPPKNYQASCLSYNFINFKGKNSTNALSKEEQSEIFQKISEISKDEKLIMKGSLGRVYKINLPNRPTFAVKEFTTVYEGRNPSLEAETLKKLPNDCGRVQKFVDLIENNGKQYLITTFQEGESLSKLKDIMPDKLLSNILDELFKIERAGISFYDYSMGNIVYKDNEPGFFDFEVAKKQSFTKFNDDANSDLCHMSRNTEFPLITNLAGFEIRTVGKIIGELEKYPNGEERSTDFVERYLKQASVFYDRTAELFQSEKLKKGSQMTDEAIKYSKILSKLFESPSKEIISIEKQSMRIKELLTEYWFRNDPDLDHDDVLYSDGPRYVNNLQERFMNVQQAILDLANSTKDYSVKLYCNKTSELLKRISDKEVAYLTKKLCK